MNSKKFKKTLLPIAITAVLATAPSASFGMMNNQNQPSEGVTNVDVQKEKIENLNKQKNEIRTKKDQAQEQILLLAPIIRIADKEINRLSPESIDQINQEVIQNQNLVNNYSQSPVKQTNPHQFFYNLGNSAYLQYDIDTLTKVEGIFTDINKLEKLLSEELVNQIKELDAYLCECKKENKKVTSLNQNEINKIRNDLKSIKKNATIIKENLIVTVNKLEAESLELYYQKKELENSE